MCRSPYLRSINLPDGVVLVLYDRGIAAILELTQPAEFVVDVIDREAEFVDAGEPLADGIVGEGQRVPIGIGERGDLVLRRCM